ncbi:hypothetical protein VMT65_35170 [Nocardia sp. CDC153]|uniref:hypothetical protein n=1 Tax=Nocardia sp. CDC153 TaxID=3112167 RepID=UPI002DB667E2|nr:hypothetical protein [Nocardia sp. CDC153]MEC3958319.1 hypothetical protein [Nocardia sp. CDC153]
MTMKSSMAICLMLTSLIATSCSDKNSPNEGSSTETPTSSASFPYPPLEFRWDIAVPLDAQAEAAAKAALETAALEDRMRAHEDAALIPQINSRVTYDRRWTSDGIRQLPETGGSLTRAVDVNKTSDNQWTVTYCVYNTPGAYAAGDNGQLRLSNPNWKYTPYADVVALTSERSGTGETSPTPRLLVTAAPARPELQTYPGVPNDLPRQTCEPFMPNPFIQQPPAPLPAGK